MNSSDNIYPTVTPRELSPMQQSRVSLSSSLIKLASDLAERVDGIAVEVDETYLAGVIVEHPEIMMHNKILGQNPRIKIACDPRKPSRITIYGLWPYSKVFDRHYQPFERKDMRGITCSRLKRIDIIAKQVNDKLLPVYLNQFQSCMMQLIEDEKKKEEREIVMKEMADLIGCELPPSEGGYPVINERIPATQNNTSVFFTVRAYSKLEGSFKFDGDMNLIKKLCAFYAEERRAILKQISDRKTSNNG